MHMADGAITGVIDFGNIVMGDPDTEFAEIYLEHGDVVLKQVARLYGHGDPDYLCEKMWRLSIVNQVEVIIDDVEIAPEGVVAQVWVTLQQLLAQA